MQSAEGAAFQRTVKNFYAAHGRHDLPWRMQTDPYAILVSELMLQQTQVSRALPKFNEFMQRFPAVESLAHSSFSEVLAIWLGLGYNRRARFLHLAAQEVVKQWNGVLPADQAVLESLPGIGPNTAGAIMAYAFNEPSIFIETNVRTVYIHHFFPTRNDVHDREVKVLLEQTIDTQNPREWYWALMDYGSYLKKVAGNNIARSRHYKKQSQFEGSLRQLRGAILRQLRQQPTTLAAMQTHLPDERLEQAVRALQAEGFIEEVSGIICLTGASKLP